MNDASLRIGRRPISVLALSLIALLAGALRVDATDVTSCGQTIAALDTGILQTDLDCSGSQFGVRLLAGATLDLNGHAVRGGDVTEATVLGIGHEDGTGRARFTIVGPGEISGTGHEYPTFGTWGCIQVNDGLARVSGGTGRIDVHGCIYGVLGSAGESPNGRARVTLEHVDFHDLTFDAAAVGKLSATDVTASDNGGQGLGAERKTVVADVVANNNVRGHGVFSGGVLKGTNVSTSGNITGVEAWGTLALVNASSSGNQYFGVTGKRVKLTNSIITGNGIADIASRSLPRLVDTTCGTSMDFNSNSWGVCENDSPSGAFLD
jgi:hypothetical protein